MVEAAKNIIALVMRELPGKIRRTVIVQIFRDFAAEEEQKSNFNEG